MTRQPDDPGVDHEREGTRLNQHGDPVMPWDEPQARMDRFARIGLALSFWGVFVLVGGVLAAWVLT